MPARRRVRRQSRRTVFLNVPYSRSLQGAICAVLEVLDKPAGSPTASEVLKLHRLMRAYVPTIKRRHRNQSLFSTRVYGELVAFGSYVARQMEL